MVKCFVKEIIELNQVNKMKKFKIKLITNTDSKKIRKIKQDSGFCPDKKECDLILNESGDYYCHVCNKYYK